MPEYRSTFVYSPSLARRACLAYLWDRYAVFVIISPLIFGFAVMGLRSRANGGLAGILVGVILVYWLGVLSILRRAGRSARVLGSPTVEVVANDEGCEWTSANMQMKIKWARIRAVRRRKQLWFVFLIGSTSPTVLDTAMMDPEMQEHFLGQVRKVGGMVR